MRILNGKKKAHQKSQIRQISRRVRISCYLHACWNIENGSNLSNLTAVAIKYFPHCAHFHVDPVFPVYICTFWVSCSEVNFIRGRNTFFSCTRNFLCPGSSPFFLTLFWSSCAYLLAGVGVPIRTRGQTLWYIYVLVHRGGGGGMQKNRGYLDGERNHTNL